MLLHKGMDEHWDLGHRGIFVSNQHFFPLYSFVFTDCLLCFQLNTWSLRIRLNFWAPQAPLSCSANRPLADSIQSYHSQLFQKVLSMVYKFSWYIQWVESYWSLWKEQVSRKKKLMHRAGRGFLQSSKLGGQLEVKGDYSSVLSKIFWAVLKICKLSRLSPQIYPLYTIMCPRRLGCLDCISQFLAIDICLGSDKRQWTRSEKGWEKDQGISSSAPCFSHTLTVATSSSDSSCCQAAPPRLMGSGNMAFVPSGCWVVTTSC